MKVSERCKRLREIAVYKKTYERIYSLRRVVYYTIGGEMAMKEGLAPDEIVAAATAHVIENFKPFIAPDECIAGVNYSEVLRADNYIPQDTEEDRQLMRENGISQEDIDAYYAASETARGYKFCYGMNIGENIPVTLTRLEEDTDTDRAAIGRCICHNHSVIGYEQVLKKGYAGLYEEILQYEAQNGSSPFYNGMKIVCQAAMKIGEIYAEEAECLMGDARYNTEDLAIIRDVCRRVPKHPARNFREAVQSLWLAHVINTYEDTINANSVGRLDQMLYQYYKKDIEDGTLTQEEAFEIICCLWLKLYRDYDVQQCCVGGTKPDGTTAVNELSYMMLEATEKLDFVRCMSVRFSPDSPKAFIKRALEVVGHVQKGVPFFFNDGVMIPALLSKGIAREDAYNYTQLGCVETLIPGKTNPYAVSGEANLLKSIEYILCEGYSMMYPELACGVNTGSIESLDSFEKFYAAVLEQSTHILDITCGKIRKYREAIRAPKPYKSLLTEGCMEKGRDFNDKGAVYDYYQVMIEGVPNLADSLAVIKKFVYEDHKYTLQEMKQILEGNYADEAVRLEFVNKAPKFGNDIAEVDGMAADLIHHSCDVLEQMSEKYGMSFHAQPFTFLWMIDAGHTSAASPDGRRAGEIIAYSVSPMQGRDWNGLTAVLNSISSLPTERTPGTTSAIIEVDPKLFNDGNIDILTEILLASARKGLSNIQFNTIDAETLMDAQKNPEHYNNLAVRVSGFSQKFNLLGKEMQDHIIGRTKHACL